MDSSRNLGPDLSLSDRNWSEIARENDSKNWTPLFRRISNFRRIFFRRILVLFVIGDGCGWFRWIPLEIWFRNCLCPIEIGRKLPKKIIRKIGPHFSRILHFHRRSFGRVSRRSMSSKRLGDIFWIICEIFIKGCFHPNDFLAE
jgi:hypothetical protein